MNLKRLIRTNALNLKLSNQTIAINVLRFVTKLINVLNASEITVFPAGLHLPPAQAQAEISISITENNVNTAVRHNTRISQVRNKNANKSLAM
jgi:hypothetical protein